MESSPDGTHSLSILEAFPEDSGNYRCVARNKAGETTCGALLKVQGQSLYGSLYSERRKYFVDWDITFLEFIWIFFVSLLKYVVIIVVENTIHMSF